jgi:hypothetical protein
LNQLKEFFNIVSNLFKQLKSINLHKIIKNLIFISCFIISVYLMIQLTTSLSMNPNTKKQLIFVAIVVESTAMFAFLKAKLLWSKGKWEWGKIKNRVIAILLFSIYGMYITMAISSAIGYFNMESNQQNTISQQITDINERDKREYNQNANQIESYQKQYEKETDKRGEISRELEKEIKKLKEEQKELKKSLNKVNKNTDEVPKNTLFYLKKVYSQNENVLSIYIFGMLAFIAFTGQIITAPNLKDDDKQDDNDNKSKEPELTPFQEKCIIYVNELFRGRKANGTKDDERLNGDPVVSAKTQMPEEECNKLREYLKNLKVNGGMALRSGQGGTYANYSKEKIIKYIKTHELIEMY